MDGCGTIYRVELSNGVIYSIQNDGGRFDG